MAWIPENAPLPKRSNGWWNAWPWWKIATTDSTAVPASTV